MVNWQHFSNAYAVIDHLVNLCKTGKSGQVFVKITYHWSFQKLPQNIAINNGNLGKTGKNKLNSLIIVLFNYIKINESFG